jgi:hypothetical protein
MHVMAPTVHLEAQQSVLGNRAATIGRGRGLAGSRPAQNARLAGATSITSQEATISAADVLKAVVEGARTGPPPPRNPVPDETAVTSKDAVQLELIKSLLKGESTYRADVAGRPGLPSGSAPPAHVDVLT